MHRGEHQADEIRVLIAQEAARLMYEEGVREYRDAKRKAGRRFGAEKALSLGSHLPTNAEIHAEIHAELQRLLLLHEEKVLPERLLHLRCLALRLMELSNRFVPISSARSSAASSPSGAISTSTSLPSRARRSRIICGRTMSALSRRW